MKSGSFGDEKNGDSMMEFDCLHTSFEVVMVTSGNLASIISHYPQ